MTDERMFARFRISLSQDTEYVIQQEYKQIAKDCSVLKRKADPATAIH